MIFSAFARALGQIGDPRFLRVLLLGVGLTILLFLAVGWGTFALVDWLLPDEISILGRTITVLDEAGGFLASGFIVGLGAVFLGGPVAIAFASIFLDTVADAVEQRHYPGLPPSRDVPILDSLRDNLGLFFAMVGLNLLAFLLFFIVGPLAPALFWLVNGYLLGREYFQLVALRWMPLAEANAARRRHVATIWAAGTLMAAPLSVPIVNLFIPILGAATFTHIFHALEPRR